MESLDGLSGLYEWAELFIKSFSGIGDILLSKPFGMFEGAADVLYKYSNLEAMFGEGSAISVQIAETIYQLSTLNLATILCGVGFSAILLYRIIKFVVGIITGS